MSTVSKTWAILFPLPPLPYMHDRVRLPRTIGFNSPQSAREPVNRACPEF